MKMRYDKDGGVFVWFQKDEGEIQLALRTLNGIAHDMDDAAEADTVEHFMFSVIESENSHLN